MKKNSFLKTGPSRAQLIFCWMGLNLFLVNAAHSVRSDSLREEKYRKTHYYYCCAKDIGWHTLKYGTSPLTFGGKILGQSLMYIGKHLQKPFDYFFNSKKEEPSDISLIISVSKTSQNGNQIESQIRKNSSIISSLIDSILSESTES